MQLFVPLDCTDVRMYFVVNMLVHMTNFPKKLAQIEIAFLKNNDLSSETVIWQKNESKLLSSRLAIVQDHKHCLARFLYCHPALSLMTTLLVLKLCL